MAWISPDGSWTKHSRSPGTAEPSAGSALILKEKEKRGSPPCPSLRRLASSRLSRWLFDRGGGERSLRLTEERRGRSRSLHPELPQRDDQSREQRRAQVGGVVSGLVGVVVGAREHEALE